MYEKRATSTKIYHIWAIYCLRMKESDSVIAHLNAYKSIITVGMLEDTSVMSYGTGLLCVSSESRRGFELEEKDIK